MYIEPLKAKTVAGCETRISSFWAVRFVWNEDNIEPAVCGRGFREVFGQANIIGQPVRFGGTACTVLPAIDFKIAA